MHIPNFIKNYVILTPFEPNLLPFCIKLHYCTIRTLNQHFDKYHVHENLSSLILIIFVGLWWVGRTVYVCVWMSVPLCSPCKSPIYTWKPNWTVKITGLQVKPLLKKKIVNGSNFRRTYVSNIFKILSYNVLWM